LKAHENSKAIKALVGLLVACLSAADNPKAVASAVDKPQHNQGVFITIMSYAEKQTAQIKRWLMVGSTMVD
jgi:hypothetical protein